MAIKLRNILKTFFETGDKPTQQQFWDWHDSYWHKTDDAIPVENIDGLAEILDEKADKATQSTVILPIGQAYYDMPTGSILEMLWFQLTTTTDGISVGTTAGADDVFEAAGPDENGNILIAGLKPFKTVTRLFFTGVQPDTITIIYKR
jgi:hypothetical protein